MIKQNYSTISLAYLLLLPTVVVLTFALKIVPLFVSDGINLENNLFLEGMKANIFPERFEQMRYILAIALVPTVFTLLLLVFHRKIEFLTSFGRSIAFYGALLIQFSLLIFCVYNGNIGNPSGSLALTPYQPSFFIVGIALCTLFAFIFFLINTEFRNLSINKWIAYLIVITYILSRLLPSVSFDKHGASYDFLHESILRMEFMAVLNGNTPFVDFFSQYQNIISYMSIPIFSVFGFSGGIFTLTSISYLFVGMVLMWRVFKNYTNSEMGGVILLIPYISVGFFPMDTVGSVVNSYNWFPVGLARYFGWMLVTYLLCKTLQRNYSYTRMVVLFIVGGLVAINNADFGIPSLIGSVVAILLTTGQSLLPSLKTGLKIGATFFISLLITVGLFIGFTYIRACELPDIHSIFSYQRIFAYYGFGMIPMPDWGLQWLIYMTFMAAILVAVYKKLSRGESPLNSQERLRIGLLTFSGISGCGIAMYYVGRSHPNVMVAIFTAWSFALLLLVWEQIDDWKNNWRHFSQRDHLIRYLPTAVLLFAYCSFLGNILTTPSPFVQLARIMSSNDGSYQQTIDNAATFIKSHTYHGEKVTIIYTLGHEVANVAHVFNVFPYAGPHSLILKDQVNKVMLQAKIAEVKKIFVKSEIYKVIPVELMEQVSRIYMLSADSNAEWQYFVRK